MIEEAEEFSGGGDEGDFGGFAVLAEAVVEGGQRGSGADDAQGGEVESAADAAASALEVTMTLSRAAVVVEGSQAGQSTDLAAGGVAEFGELS